MPPACLKVDIAPGISEGKGDTPVLGDETFRQVMV